MGCAPAAARVAECGGRARAGHGDGRERTGCATVYGRRRGEVPAPSAGIARFRGRNGAIPEQADCGVRAGRLPGRRGNLPTPRAREQYAAGTMTPLAAASRPPERGARTRAKGPRWHARRSGSGPRAGIVRPSGPSRSSSPSAHCPACSLARIPSTSDDPFSPGTSFDTFFSAFSCVVAKKALATHRPGNMRTAWTARGAAPRTSPARQQWGDAGGAAPAAVTVSTGVPYPPARPCRPCPIHRRGLSPHPILHPSAPACPTSP